MGFQQAVNKVEKEKEYEELKGVISQVFSSDWIEKFLKRMSRENLRVRDWDSLLTQRVLEQVTKSSVKSARDLYTALPVSDQAQIREFYLSRVEEVDSGLRARFQKLYRYY